MAEQKDTKKQKTEAKAPRQAQHAQATKAGKEHNDGVQEKQPLSTYLLALAVIIVIAVAATLFYYAVPAVTGVSFSTFKTGFQSSPRVALAVTYLNETQFSAEVPCYTTLLEILGRTRQASTIDFLLINQTKCQYSPTGLGASASFKTVNASSCIEIANSEPAIFINYSAYNSTKITQSHLYLSANGNYFASCPIAAEFG